MSARSEWKFQKENSLNFVNLTREKKSLTQLQICLAICSGLENKRKVLSDMSGVEILSSETIYNTILPEWCIALGLILGIAFMAATIFTFIDDYNILGCICLVMMIASIIVACLADSKRKTDISYIEYKVTIDDSVSMTEFMDKYEILDQDGKIYIVKERE